MRAHAFGRVSLPAKRRTVIGCLSVALVRCRARDRYEARSATDQLAEEAPRAPRSGARLSRSDEIRVLEALDAIVASGALGGGEPLPALLRYLVTEELAGRGERIKAFAIATEVLGRGPDFDPQLDSIARTAMTRLRKALGHLAVSNIDAGSVSITIPKGSYRPRIELSAPEETAANPEDSKAVLPAEALPQPRRWLWAGIVLAMLAAAGLALLALPVWQDAAQRPATLPPLILIEGRPEALDGEAALGPALRAELAAELARQQWLTVVIAEPPPTTDTTLTAIARQRQIFVLNVQTIAGDDGVRNRVFLKRWPERSILWSNAYVFADLAKVRSVVMRDIAGIIARDLTSPGGGIMLTEPALRDDDHRAETQFSCLLAMRHHWRSYDEDAGREAERCLKEAIIDNPAFAAGRGALAFYMIERGRNLGGEARAAQLAAAEALIARSSGGNPMLDSARMALAACKADMAGVRRVAHELATAHPNNPDVPSDAGSKLGMVAGDWAQATVLEARAMALNPQPDPWYPLASLTHHLIKGEPGQAMGLLERTEQRAFVAGQIARLGIGAALQDGLLLADAHKRLGDLGLPGGDDRLPVVERQCWSDETKGFYRKGIPAAIPQ